MMLVYSVWLDKIPCWTALLTKCVQLTIRSNPDLTWHHCIEITWIIFILIRDALY